MIAGLSLLRLGYAGAFGLVAVWCVIAAFRARRIDHLDTRRGLVGLLILSGGWALIQGVRLLTPWRQLQVALVFFALIVGLASIGAWLYFCSAYTGRSYHRHPTYRRIALGVFLAISALKITNPIHGLYLSILPLAEPFPHIATIPSLLHWSVAGLAYVLSAIGFYMLFQLFDKTNYDTTRLGVLVSLAGAPAIATIVGYVGFGPFIQMDYEPIGVAVFAIGTLYFAEDSFKAVGHHGRSQVLNDVDQAVIVLDETECLRGYNLAAADLFPAVSRSSQGTHLKELVSEVASALETDQQVIKRTINDETRYFNVTDETLLLGPHETGRTLVFTEVTEIKRHKKELARREEQLDDFAAALRHELLNAVTIVDGQVSLAEKELNNDQLSTVRRRFETVQDTTDRMTRVISDLSTLTQHGGLVTKTDTCDLEEMVRAAKTRQEHPDLSVTVGRNGTIEADRARLQRLIMQALEFASKNDTSHVHVALIEHGLVIEDDGEPVPADKTDNLFKYGEAVPDAKTGSILPPVQTLARAHGWAVSVDTAYEDGLKYQINDTNNERERFQPADESV